MAASMLWVVARLLLCGFSLSDMKMWFLYGLHHSFIVHLWIFQLFSGPAGENVSTSDHLIKY